MFTLALAVIPLALVITCLSIRRHYKIMAVEAGKKYDGEAMAWAIFFMFVVVLVPIIATVMTFASYSDQISDAENIERLERLEEVYEARADNLTQQFATYLADLYPEHERGIFEEMAPDGIDIYLVKYPDLKASETVLALVAQIRSMQDDRYTQQIERENTLKEMRYRMRNPWIFNSFIPSE